MKCNFEVEMMVYTSNSGCRFDVPVALVERLARLLDITVPCGDEAYFEYQTSVLDLLLLAQGLGLIDSNVSLHLLFDSIDKFRKGVQNDACTSND